VDFGQPQCMPRAGDLPLHTVSRGDNPSMASHDLSRAADAIARLGRGTDLTATIRSIEASLAGKQRRAAQRTVAKHEIDQAVLSGALAIKDLAGQINVVVHTVGILVALPHILQRDERIESVSLGAGNTGRDHDLVTDRRIAEFKFIQWRGGAESIRQNSLFIDLFNLASATTSKARYMYVVGREHPDRFLSGGRALSSVLSRNAAAAARFRSLYGDRFETVADYADHIKDRVQLVDLRDVVPAFGTDSA
jgi:hypothetical protein